MGLERERAREGELYVQKEIPFNNIHYGMCVYMDKGGGVWKTRNKYFHQNDTECESYADKNDASKMCEKARHIICKQSPSNPHFVTHSAFQPCHIPLTTKFISPKFDGDEGLGLPGSKRRQTAQEYHTQMLMWPRRIQ